MCRICQDKGKSIDLLLMEKSWTPCAHYTQCIGVCSRCIADNLSNADLMEEIALAANNPRDIKVL